MTWPPDVSPRLWAAVERCRLPIAVWYCPPLTLGAYEVEPGDWSVMDCDDGVARRCFTASAATACYLAAVADRLVAELQR